MSSCSCLPRASATARNWAATSHTASERTKASGRTGRDSSSIRESVTRLAIRSDRRAAWQRMFATHSLPGSSASSTSALVEMMVMGVLSSWPASVTNWRCFSRLRSMGRMIRFDSRYTAANTSPYATTATDAEMPRNVYTDRRSRSQLRNTASSPSPSAVR